MPISTPSLSMSSELLVSLTPCDFTIITTKHLPGLWIMTWISDHYKERLNLILVSLVFVILGGVLVTQLEAPTARYGALFIMQFGNYATGPLQVTFLANNTPTPGHRAMIMAISSMNNLIGIVAAVSLHSGSKEQKLSLLTCQRSKYSSPNTVPPIRHPSTSVSACPSSPLSATSPSASSSSPSTAGGPRRWRP